MRIQRLELIRYGHFTDLSIDLPYRKPDFHILFGPNEAGKTTALRGVEDLLFGIPSNSPFNFLHDYSSMRLGAAIRKEDQFLDFRRRKGNKDTLLTPDDIPLPAGDGAFAPFLAGADRKFFTRMFSLDHERLREGGNEILSAQDEVGQMLFSAGTGILGLRDRLREMEEEADKLWARKKAVHRLYYQAAERLQAAEASLRTHSLSVNKWQEFKRLRDSAEENCLEIEKEVGEATAELRLLGRIRRVYRNVRLREELESKISDLGNVEPMPENARREFEAAQNELASARARIETLDQQLHTVEEQLETLKFDEAILLRAQDIRRLNENRSRVRDGRTDLPQRKIELASAEANLKRLAAELEWGSLDIDELVKKIPPRQKVASIRAHLNRRGALDSAVEIARGGLEASEAAFGEAEAKVLSSGEVSGVSKLSAQLKSIRERGDFEAKIHVAEVESKTVQATMQQLLMSLEPVVADEASLAAMPIPPWDMVQIHRDNNLNLDRRIRDNAERIRTAESELARYKKEFEKITQDDGVVSIEELNRVRGRRDEGWSIIRRKYLEGKVVPQEEVQAFSGLDSGIGDAFDAAIRDTDQAADRRFEKAKAAGELSVISGQIAKQNFLLQELEQTKSALSEESRTSDAAWLDMWRDLPFSPLSHDKMLEWITTRNKIIELSARRTSAEILKKTLRDSELEAKDSLLTELGHLSTEFEAWKDQTLRVVCEGASDFLRQCERKSESKRQLQENLRTAQADVERKKSSLNKAAEAWSSWEEQWHESLLALGLRGGIDPDVVASRLDAIDQMREVIVKVNELRLERIGKIEEYIASFGREVEEVTKSVAEDLLGRDSEEAVLELEKRVGEAEKIRQEIKVKRESMELFLKSKRGFEEGHRKASALIQQFQDMAKVGSSHELWTVIERAENLRKLYSEISAVDDALSTDGDGTPLSQLKAECNGINLDQILARETAVGEDLKELQNRLLEAREKRINARQAFDSLGGDDLAAKAAADRQSALAEIKDVAERYVRLRAAALLLQWGVDRFRREKQAPLLKLAGKMFSTLTCGGFSNLMLDFDDKDNPRLAGLRATGERVPVEGMSTGTRDQLYLALRLASIHDYFERSTPLPFVADDLFINFDDARAASGFEVLGHLAEKTQVLFFTHHKHLVDVARSVLGKGINVHDLSRQPAKETVEMLKVGVPAGSHN